MSADELRGYWDTTLRKHPGWSYLLSVLRNAVMRMPLRGTEYMLAFLAASSAAWVGWPWHGLCQSDQHLYDTLTRHIPRAVWTVLLAAPAMPSIFLDGSKVWKINSRIMGQAILLAVWAMASMLFVRDGAPSLATAWVPVFGFYQALSLLQLWLTRDMLRDLHI